MDDFKKYINQHAEELDIDIPREKVWQSIKQDLAPAKRNATLVYMKCAVAACVIALAGFGLYKLQDDNNKLQVTSNQQPAIINQKPVTSNQQPAIESPVIIAKVEATKDNNQVPSAKFQVSTKSQNLKPKIKNNAQPTTINQQILQQVENSFTQIINLQKAKVNTTPLNAESPNYFNDFTIEMKRMERDEQTIKKDIAKNGLTDALLDQLINIYQQKLSVLKQLQNEINKTNNRFKQNRGPEESTKTYFLNI